MISLTENKLSESSCIVPQFLPSLKLIHPVIDQNALTKQFSLFSSRFACLATKETFKALRSQMLEIDISQELDLMNESSSLEVVVSVNGIIDLLNKSEIYNQFSKFPVVVGFNGFGAKSVETQQNNFPHSDFVLITDIVGNQYEVLVDKSGKLELPQVGTGLFSLASAITFIYSQQQVKQGLGLENLQSIGLRDNKLYLLPPTQSNEDFTFSICITHINENHQRIVDTIREVRVQFENTAQKIYDKAQGLVIRPLEESPDVLQINLSLLLLKPFMAQLPFSASIALSHPKGSEYGLVQPHGWMEHPIHNATYTKHFGLSEKTLTQVVNHLYNEYDLTKDYLKGDTFSLSPENGYNNFLLRTDGIGVFYDLLIHDVVHHKIPGDFILDRVDPSHYADLDLSDLPMDFHDSVVIAQLQTDFQEHSFQGLQQLLLTHDYKQGHIEIEDHFVVHAQGMQEMPVVNVEITQGSTLSQPILSMIDMNMTDLDSSLLSQHLDPSLLPQKLMQPIDFHEIIDFNPKTTTQEWIDLGSLLENHVSWTPLKTQVESVAQELPSQIATWGHMSPVMEVDIDPNHIHLTHF